MIYAISFFALSLSSNIKVKYNLTTKEKKSHFLETQSYEKREKSVRLGLNASAVINNILVIIAKFIKKIIKYYHYDKY